MQSAGNQEMRGIQEAQSAQGPVFPAYPYDRLPECRHLFQDEAKDQVYENFHGALADDGILFIGSTEQILHAKELGFESLRIIF